MSTPDSDYPAPRDAATTPTTTSTASRPTGVTVLAILAWIGAVFSILGGVAALVGGAAFGVAGAGAAGGAFFLGGVFLIALGVFYAITGWGLWTRRRWAWFVAAVLAGIAILQNLFALLQGEILSGIIGLLIAGLVIWYLFKPEVQGWFGVDYKVPWNYGRPA